MMGSVLNEQPPERSEKIKPAHAKTPRRKETRSATPFSALRPLRTLRLGVKPLLSFTEDSTSSPQRPPQTNLPRQLGLGTAAAAVAGEAIGVGIFLTPAGMARQLGSPFWL